LKSIIYLQEKKMAFLKLNQIEPNEIVPGGVARFVHSDNMTFAHWIFKAGAQFPEHSHPHEQTSYVAEGEIIFFCEDEPDQHLKKGDMFAVKPNKKHTIQLLTEKVRLIDNFSPLREDFLS